MDESKVKELIMILRIYLKYDNESQEKENLRGQLEKLVQELLPE